MFPICQQFHLRMTNSTERAARYFENSKEIEHNNIIHKLDSGTFRRGNIKRFTGRTPKGYESIQQERKAQCIHRPVTVTVVSARMPETKRLTGRTPMGLESIRQQQQQ